MKRVFIAAFILIYTSSSLLAQRKETLRFEEMVFDFGNVQEVAGPVTHNFQFENVSGRPVKILGVKPSCGCTTPDWTKDVVAPGAKGFVAAKFDPKSRPGFFNKTLAVTTDGQAETVVLTIKGNVVLENNYSTFRETKGNWRLVSTGFNMGKVFLKDEYVWKEFEVVNGGDAPITVNGLPIAPKHVKIDLSFTTLKEGEKGTIRVGYNGLQRNAYGFQSDNIEFITNDKELPRKSFSVYATLEEFFPPLTKEELAKSPRLALSESIIDLGRFAAGNTVERKISLINNGRQELKIRYIQSNCQCLTTELEKQTIVPGKAQSLTIRFNGEQRKGTQQKFITIYSNDPINPVQRVSIGAYIEY